MKLKVVQSSLLTQAVPSALISSKTSKPPSPRSPRSRMI